MGQPSPIDLYLGATADVAQPADVDPDLVDACVPICLPDRPERGRAAGVVALAVSVGDNATPQDGVLAAMGPTP